MKWFRLTQLERLDQKLIYFLSSVSIAAVRLTLGLTFIWFGLLKVFGESPANDLITKTIYWFNPDVFIPILGIWEAVIGLFFVIKPMIRGGLLLLALQMPGTFLPLVLLPEVCFSSFPFALTLEGQYIVKNLVLISAALVVGGSLLPIKSMAFRKLVV